MRALRRVLGGGMLLGALLGAARALADEPPRRYDDKGRPIAAPGPEPPRQAITLPEPLGYVAPEYPAEALAARLEAEVVLRLTIDEKGEVVDASVASPAGHGFDEAALAAARRLRFTPARYADGRAFKAAINYGYKFERPPAPPPAPPDSAPAPAPPGETAPPGAGTTAPDEDATPPEEPAPDVVDLFVEGDRPAREVAKRTLETRELARVPGTSGDALKGIQSLPGMARTGFMSALMIRGSAPFDSQTFVDGVYVPLIYHFGALSSAIPTELLSKIDLYPGNFSARYGRALGGVVDAGMRSPRSDGYHGMAQIDLVDARLMAEGPIPLLSGWSFAAAARRSWLDAWLGPVLEQAGASVTTAPRYYDYQLMVERKAARSRIRLSAYGSDDALALLLSDPSPDEPALTGNLGVATAFQRIQLGVEADLAHGGKLVTQTALGREVISIGLGELFVDLEALSFFGRSEYHHRLGPRAALDLGIDLVMAHTDVVQRMPAEQRPGQLDSQPASTSSFVHADQMIPVFRPGAYVEAELTPIERWRIVPGLRLDYGRDTVRPSVSPRLNTRFDLVPGFPRTTAKAGVGLFSQPPQPQQSNPPLGSEGVFDQRALHVGLGLEQELTRPLHVSLEGFYKRLDQMIVASQTAAGVSVRWTNQGLGRVLGGELLLKYEPDERFFGWLAYTLSRATEQYGPDEPEVPLSWDQTHNLVLVGSLRLGHGWELGARFRLVSGDRVAPNVCNAAAEECDPARVNAMFHAPSGTYTPIRFGDVNSERLPLFHQLDLRVDKSWRFTHWQLGIYLDVQNVYNQQNVEGIGYDFRYTTRTYVTGLPILPSFGIRGEL